MLLQTRFYEERLTATLQDRQIQREEANAHRAASHQKLKALSERLASTESALQKTAKDYILGKQTTKGTDLIGE